MEGLDAARLFPPGKGERISVVFLCWSLVVGVHGVLIAGRFDRITSGSEVVCV